MSIVTTSLLKMQLNIDHSEDDELLQQKLEAAEAWIANYTGTPWTEFDTVPADLKEGVLLLAGHLYENREATLVGIDAHELPFGLLDMIRPYREWAF
ncbi:head-tail connector protein [Phyllobacterium bourgognense]|uniref:Putative phage protein (Predicted DNA packaging) n=1 Tax=Phyllobacterium bourgognense TaxID=314236 RepID=A0A368Z1V0_9HYPH|nr:head-tail connector protein [Phyllobacterium bourgognense]RCW85436.1 putative phage protein (predicted DNA packaging) [Phyllobacterium bourgognense]